MHSSQRACACRGRLLAWGWRGLACAPWVLAWVLGVWPVSRGCWPGVWGCLACAPWVLAWGWKDLACAPWVSPILANLVTG